MMHIEWSFLGWYFGRVGIGYASLLADARIETVKVLFGSARRYAFHAWLFERTLLSDMTSSIIQIFLITFEIEYDYDTIATGVQNLGNNLMHLPTTNRAHWSP